MALKNRSRKTLEEIIRVDHAGEYGAKRIYLGQLSVLKNDPKIKEMYEQELEHLLFFENEMKQRKVRPTALSPLWHTLGFAMGAITARLGRKAAMACTVAVEEVIDEHYKEQIDKLEELEEYKDIRQKIAKFREDEIHHRDTGLVEGAEEAFGYKLLHKIIKGITKSAIILSKKI